MRRAAGLVVAVALAALSGGAALALGATRSAPGRPDFRAWVSAEKREVRATVGTHTWCRDVGAYRQCLTADAVAVLPLRGRVPVHARGSVRLRLVMPAEGVAAYLAGPWAGGLPGRVRVRRESGRRWRLLLPARLPRRLDRIALGVAYGGPNEAYFQAGVRRSGR